ncbi:hypothetical protein [Leptolyngbya sp. 7M]|uniref:hypothetical protein n=1 Tax=Leptolyngbya sp. 7M TaxID=2812896 RepID=UPI001B8BF660|nr:hypothetical protein [Leptolyngbya sp. 7M]QYO65304.1 hypothetical protein JVX88_00525 [Leptolyngbya sp. 7M]
MFSVFVGEGMRDRPQTISLLPDKVRIDARIMEVSSFGSGQLSEKAYLGAGFEQRFLVTVCRYRNLNKQIVKDQYRLICWR